MLHLLLVSSFYQTVRLRATPWVGTIEIHISFILSGQASKHKATGLGRWLVEKEDHVVFIDVGLSDL